MAEGKGERKYDLGSRAVELPDGSTFEFAWDMGAYPATRDALERRGLGTGVLDDAVDDVVALARVLEACRGLKVSNRGTQIGILWDLHHRVDCLLHALTSASDYGDSGETGPAIAQRNVERIRRQDYRFLEFAVGDGRDGRELLGALAAALGGLGD